MGISPIFERRRTGWPLVSLSLKPDCRYVNDRYSAGYFHERVPTFGLPLLCLERREVVVEPLDGVL